MRKLKGFNSEHLKNVVLYLDDLERIVEVFKEVTDKVDITLDSYALDNLSEIETLDEEFFNSVSIYGIDRSLVLSIDKSKVYLAEYEGSLETRGFFEKVKKILNERRRKFSWLFHSFWIIPILVFLSIFLIIFSNQHNNILLKIIGILIIIFVIIWPGQLIGVFYRNKIYTSRKSELSSFWKRKKDDIILAIISALIGGVITLGLLKIF